MSIDLSKVDRATLMGASRADLIQLAKDLADLKHQAGQLGPQDDDQLHKLIKDRWGIHVPRVAVDIDRGHCAPFDMIADVYFERITAGLAVGGRESGKTFNVAIIHALNARFKPGYEGISAGAVAEQSKRAYAALKKLNRMWGGQDAETKQQQVKEQESDVESSLQSETLYKNGSTVSILGGTVAQLNGPHSNLLHRDEVELFRRDAFDEANNITRTGQTFDGKPIKAVDLLTSSLKYAKGLLQEILARVDIAIQAGTEPPYKVYRWGVAETIAPVPNCRNDPKNAGLPEDQLCPCNRAVNGMWEDGSPRSLQDVCAGKKSAKLPGYDHRFARSDGYRPLEPDIVNKFMQNSKIVWEAQQECIKPAAEGLILENFTKERHGIRNFMPDPENGFIFNSTDFGGCYDEETEILTARGWVATPDLRDDDKFASMNPETEKVEFQQADQIVRKFYTGDLNRWQNNSVDLLVTEDHNMVVAPLGSESAEGKWGLVRSHSVQNHSRMMKTSKGRVDSESKPFVLCGAQRGDGVRLPDLAIDAEHWAAFLGLWMAEGHTNVGITPAGNRRQTGTVGITHYDESNIIEIKKILDRYFNARNEINFQTKRGQLVINDARLYAHLSRFGKAGQKRLPEYVKNWDQDLLRIMIDWHTRGDGDDRGRIYTGSKDLADDLQEIAMYAGYAADITVRPPRDSVINGRKITAKLNQYTVSIKKTQTRPRVHNKPHETPVRSEIKKSDHDGLMVYCPVLPKWHTLYVRRNGKAVWCGNTNAHASNWYQLLNKMVVCDSYDGDMLFLPKGALVCFDEIYVTEVGNIALANMVVAKEYAWKQIFPFWIVSERYADVAAKAARLDWRSHQPPLPTIWRITREIEEHIAKCVNLVDNMLFFVDVERCPMFLDEAESWQRDPDTGKQLDVFNHAMSDFRYAVANIDRKYMIQQMRGANDRPAAAQEEVKPVKDRFDLGQMPATGPSSAGLNDMPSGIPMHAGASAYDVTIG